jgi:hypothetical protein
MSHWQQQWQPADPRRQQAHLWDLASCGGCLGFVGGLLVVLIVIILVWYSGWPGSLLGH